MSRLQVAIPVAVALAAAGAAGLRYGLQGTGDVYTSAARAFYLEDPIFGWSVTRERWVWLGLDALALVLALALATLALAWLAGALARRHRDGELGRGLPTLALTSFWVGALLCLATPAIPIAAFASGSPPAEALAAPPESAPAVPAAPHTSPTPAAPDGAQRVDAPAHPVAFGGTHRDRAAGDIPPAPTDDAGARTNNEPSSKE